MNGKRAIKQNAANASKIRRAKLIRVLRRKKIQP